VPYPVPEAHAQREESPAEKDPEHLDEDEVGQDSIFEPGLVVLIVHQTGEPQTGETSRL
jgi:hypothetical protein